MRDAHPPDHFPGEAEVAPGRAGGKPFFDLLLRYDHLSLSTALTASQLRILNRFMAGVAAAGGIDQVFYTAMGICGVLFLAMPWILRGE